MAVIVVYIDGSGEIAAVTEEQFLSVPEGAKTTLPIAKEIVNGVMGKATALPIINAPTKAYLISLIRTSPKLTEAQKFEAVELIKRVGPAVPLVVREGAPVIGPAYSAGVPPTTPALFQRYVDP